MRQLRVFLEMVKFEHTIFALPFAYLGMVLAAGGWPGWHLFIWITVAMAAARTFAFAINRLADRFYDARNPRTSGRALPRGQISPLAVGFLAGAALVVLALAAWRLNAFVLALLPCAVVLLVGYSYTKRFTWASHWILGITDGMAPVGAWAAVTASLASPAPWLLWFTVTVWMAGFDIIYACQDVEFDHALDLHSIPKKFGIAAALYASAALHVLMLALLVMVAQISGLGWIALAGLVAVAALLGYEHLLVKPSDLSRVNAAFFTINGYISVLFFLTWAAAILVR
jgi:4-hydroxybenzoate polyprenyltransferase